MPDNTPNNQDFNEPRQPGTAFRKYRVSRLRTQIIKLPPIHPSRALSGVTPLSFIFGFAAIIIAGALLLMLPISSHTGQVTSFVTGLFTSASAVSLTGLVIVDTLEHWSLFGQIVIALLIQLGGLGFMTTSTTLFMLLAGRRIGLRGRILMGESMGTSQIGGVVRLARNILVFILVAEIVGVILFYIRFSDQYGWLEGIWKSVFQSISAFNNAGFDIFGGHQSLSGYSGDYMVLLTTAALIIIGGISFPVVNNLFHARSFHRSSIDTKLVLSITLILLAAGTVFILATEYNNPQTLGDMPLSLKTLNSFFQSVSARTGGFSTLNAGLMNLHTLLFIVILMFIGGSSGSTAGGIKVNTFGLIILTVWNTLRGREYPQVFGREIRPEQIFRAVTLLGLFCGLVGLVFLVLSLTENFPSISILFETVSAFGTAGLSTGITPELSLAGKIILVVVMFIGRLGPLTLTMALTRTPQPDLYRYPKDSVTLG
jgi:trk system potassium uptake protein